MYEMHFGDVGFRVMDDEGLQHPIIICVGGSHARITVSEARRAFTNILSEINRRCEPEVPTVNPTIQPKIPILPINIPWVYTGEYREPVDTDDGWLAANPVVPIFEQNICLQFFSRGTDRLVHDAGAYGYRRWILKRTDKEKKWRPFKNISEYLPYRDRWLRGKSGLQYRRIIHILPRMPFDKMFDELVWDGGPDDGKPFGIQE